MIRQTDMPGVQRGDEVTAALLNQIIGGSNRWRMVSGDEIDISMIGNMLGLNGARPAAPERNLTVEVTADRSHRGVDSRELRLPGAIYQGKMYLQPVISVPDPKVEADVYNSTPTVAPVPAMQTCYVLNLEEFDLKTHWVMKTVVTAGRIIGTFRGAPLVGVCLPAKEVTVIITAAGGGGGKYEGRMLTGVPTMADSSVMLTGDLAMPEGMTVPSSADAVVFNLAENGSSAHALAVDGSVFARGKIVSNTTDGLAVVFIDVGAGGGGTVPPGTLFAVDLSSPSASSGGDASSACAITYTVTDKLSAVLLTGASPECPRGIGLRSAATKGTAYYDADDNPVLFWANEPEGASLPDCGVP